LGGAWGPSTIHGNRQRGTGILNNELYIGTLVWNRARV
jgi:site-specific DNA recombinase